LKFLETIVKYLYQATVIETGRIIKAIEPVTKKANSGNTILNYCQCSKHLVYWQYAENCKSLSSGLSSSYYPVREGAFLNADWCDFESTPADEENPDPHICHKKICRNISLWVHCYGDNTTEINKI